MGWSTNTQYAKRSDKKTFILSLMLPWKNKNIVSTCLSHSVRGNVVWSVWENTNRNTNETERFIVCDLISFFKNDSWGNKSMTEDCGPYQYSCPLKFLKMAPAHESQIAKDWRKKVIEYHQSKRISKIS